MVFTFQVWFGRVSCRQCQRPSAGRGGGEFTWKMNVAGWWRSNIRFFSLLRPSDYWHSSLFLFVHHPPPSIINTTRLVWAFFFFCCYQPSCVFNPPPPPPPRPGLGTCRSSLGRYQRASLLGFRGCRPASQTQAPMDTPMPATLWGGEGYEWWCGDTTLFFISHCDIWMMMCYES